MTNEQPDAATPSGERPHAGDADMEHEEIDRRFAVLVSEVARTIDWSAAALAATRRGARHPGTDGPRAIGVVPSDDVSADRTVSATLPTPTGASRRAGARRRPALVAALLIVAAASAVVLRVSSIDGGPDHVVVESAERGGTDATTALPAATSTPASPSPTAGSIEQVTPAPHASLVTAPGTPNPGGSSEPAGPGLRGSDPVAPHTSPTAAPTLSTSPSPSTPSTPATRATEVTGAAPFAEVVDVGENDAVVAWRFPGEPTPYVRVAYTAADGVQGVIGAPSRSAQLRVSGLRPNASYVLEVAGATGDWPIVPITASTRLEITTKPFSLAVPQTLRWATITPTSATVVWELPPDSPLRAVQVAWRPTSASALNLSSVEATEGRVQLDLVPGESYAVEITFADGASKVTPSVRFDLPAHR